MDEDRIRDLLREIRSFLEAMLLREYIPQERDALNGLLDEIDEVLNRE